MMTNIKLSKWTLEFITKKEQYKINECGQQPVTKKLVRGLLLHRNPISNLIIEIKKRNVRRPRSVISLNKN